MKKIISNTTWNYDDALYISSTIQNILHQQSWKIEKGYEYNSALILKSLKEFLEKENIESHLIELFSTNKKESIGYALDCSGVVWSLIGIKTLADFHSIPEDSIYGKFNEPNFIEPYKYEELKAVLERFSRVTIDLKECYFIFHSGTSLWGETDIVEISQKNEKQHDEAILNSDPMDQYSYVSIQMGKNMNAENKTYPQKIKENVNKAINFIADEINFSTNSRQKKMLKNITLELKHKTILIENLFNNAKNKIYLGGADENFYFNINLNSDENKKDFLEFLNLNTTLTSLSKIGYTYDNSQALQKNVLLKNIKKCDFNEVKIAFTCPEDYKPLIPSTFYYGNSPKHPKKQIITKEDMVTNIDILNHKLFKRLPYLKTIVDIEKQEYLEQNIEIKTNSIQPKTRF